MSLALPRPFVLAAIACWASSAAMYAQNRPDYEQPPISYSDATPHDALARLRDRIAAGEIAFKGSDQVTLKAVLDALQVPVESQVLVFSKTSFQRSRIRPEQPRALYFSESVYVGWVPGGLIEVAAVDPELGPIFYSFDLVARGAKPKIERDSDCLRCHGGAFVREIPGVLARSVFPDTTGEPLLRHGTVVVDDETPFAERWGGWYVTGYHGTENHRGNVLGSERADQLVFPLSDKRPDELKEFFDTSRYLAPTSDVVALLVLEHQMTVQNALTRANLSARKMIAYQHGLQKAFNEPITDEPAYDSVKSVFGSAVEDVVDRLLFRRAAALPEGVRGGEAFRAAFARNAPRSRAGYSLKDLKLQDQIFAQRCSYLIYSEAFRALPDPLRLRIFDRLGAALRSQDPKDRYAYLGAEEKQRIYDILVETLPEARARWQAADREPVRGQ
jgi:hypothetical protein